MSRDMHICCVSCQEALWIGQTDIIYTGMPDVMETLNKFLVTHRTLRLKAHDPDNYHELLYTPEPYNGDFEEIDWKYWEGDPKGTPEHPRS